MPPGNKTSHTLKPAVGFREGETGIKASRPNFNHSRQTRGGVPPQSLHAQASIATQVGNSSTASEAAIADCQAKGSFCGRHPTDFSIFAERTSFQNGIIIAETPSSDASRQSENDTACVADGVPCTGGFDGKQLLVTESFIFLYSP